ncbi:DcuS/MalK family sensor histidine kinase [Natronincola ferrireducens]|uniref:histidine kinase n=1 Tax=Natronincola ferrireducens TaxID=393762 RepID=A0A1G9FYC3_9FIRM|nr:sensor histidine kinase [Natronincola ferrireducens]SDK93163.1 two-component system, CitB family, sensor histidine kinase DctS [Natronincola ferrireducens]
MTSIKNMRLVIKIILLSLIITISSVLISIGLTTKFAKQTIQNETEKNVLNISRTVARIPSIVDAFETEDPASIIQPIVENIRKAAENVEFIVVTNLEGIRYSHPNPFRIGSRFVGGDEEGVLLEGKEYISMGEGTLGLSTRAFTPIYNSQNQRIGMVSVGILNQQIYEQNAQLNNYIHLAIFLGVLFGFLCSILLARSIKYSLMGLEPSEIAKLFKERNAILETVKEGIIAIDANGSITLINSSAKKTLAFPENDTVGKSIEKIIPYTDMIKVLESCRPIYDEDRKIHGINVMMNIVPILDNDNPIGAIASFRDKSEITALAEELTGFKMLVDSLRANTHEFMNKLHVILGLIQLKDYKEAEKYIINLTTSHQEIISFMVKNIKDTSVAALLLGKYSSAKELGIDMNIHSSSYLEKLPSHIPSSLMVTIIGNLLENSFDAVKDQSEKKQVDCLIKEKKNQIIISIKDNGYGIDSLHKNFIFQKGYTTKKDGRGVGLYLVKQNVDSLEGSIHFKAQRSKGTHIVIKIPRTR